MDLKQEYTFVVKGWKASLITLGFTILFAAGILKVVEVSIALTKTFFS